MNIHLLRAMDEAMAKADLDNFFSYYTDDVVSHVRGRSRIAGDYEGKDQLRALFGRFMEAVGTYTSENHAYLADNEHGIILQRGHCERDGKALELEEVFVMHFREGRISEMWYIPTDQAALDAWIG
jgi:ketosteroid isomerase-like protein